MTVSPCDVYLPRQFFSTVMKTLEFVAGTGNGDPEDEGVGSVARAMT